MRTSSMVSLAAEVNVEVLLSGRGSAVALETEAVLVTCETMLSVSSNAALMLCPAILGRTPIMQEMVPLPPGAGVVQLNCGPDDCVHPAKLLPDGTASVSVTLAASFGPAFATVMMNVSPPPVTATETSADAACDVTVVERLPLLLAEFGSVSSAEIVAVFVSTVPAATPLLMRNVKRNVGRSLDARRSRVSALQVMVPLVPTAGVVQVKTASGSEMVADTNVAFAGTASVICT
jgi:hypothetical protein